MTDRRTRDAPDASGPPGVPSGRETDERFLAEAVARSLLTTTQADDCRRLVAALGEVDVALSLDEILARKGYLDRERSAELRRALARQRVGRYEVIERLGAGGSGVVWKARDVVLDRLVALKLLSRDARGDDVWRERFLREARTAVTLNHVAIVRGIDCGESDGYLYFAMEYVPGESVAARLEREGRLPEAEALRIAAEVVRALRYVASLGIVHRDLKPENLLVTPDGRVKVCDLGLAKPTREEADRGGPDAVVAGTPLYLAPEQIVAGDRVDWRADVYSLGATLYHMLAGRPPFPWEPGKDLLRRHLEEIPQSPREFALDVTPNAAAVVLKMLRKDPGDRYARLEDLEEDLESVIAGRPPRNTLSFAQRERPPLDPEAARVAAAESAPPRVTWAMKAVVAALVVAGAFAAVRYVLVSRVEDVAARPDDGPSAPSPGVRASPQPSAASGVPFTPAHAPAPPSPHESAAFHALDTARRAATEPGADLRERRDAFQFVAERYPGTSAAGIAEGLVREIEREIERVADRALHAAQAFAADLEAAGRLADAQREFERVAADHPTTTAAKSASAEVRRLADTARARIRERFEEVREAIASGDFDTARRRLDEAAALGGGPRTDVEIASRRQEIARAQAEAERQRLATKSTFDRVWAAAILAARPKGLDAALDALDSASGELRPWIREIDTLRLDLLQMPASDAEGLDTSPVALRGVFFARLTRRDVAGAEATLAALDAAGAETQDLRAGLARVRAALAESADALLLRAEQARVERRLDDAARLVDEALADVPGYARARVAAAMLLADRGRPEQAVVELESVLALPEPPAEVHLRLGQLLAARPETFERAQRELENFLVRADSTDPLREIAEEARAAVVARRSATRTAELRIELDAARRRGNPAAVAATAEELRTLGRADSDDLLHLSDAYAELGRPHDAYLVARGVADAGSGPESAAAQRRLKQIDKRFAASLESRDAVAAARELLALRDVARAREVFEEVLTRAPFLEDALAGGAEAYLERKGSGPYALSDEPAKALRLTRILLLRNPQHVRGGTLHAKALLRSGAVKEALPAALAAMEQDVARPDAATTAGFAALELGDPQRAADLFRMSLERGRTPEAFYGRALAWERLSHRQSARKEAVELVATFRIPEEMKEDVDALLGRLGLEIEPEGGVRDLPERAE